MSKVASDTSSRAEAPGRGALVRRLVWIAVVVYVILFIVFNRHRVEISFVFFTVHTLTLVALAVVAVLSFGAGYLGHRRRAKRRAALPK